MNQSINFALTEFCVEFIKKFVNAGREKIAFRLITMLRVGVNSGILFS